MADADDVSIETVYEDAISCADEGSALSPAHNRACDPNPGNKSSVTPEVALPGPGTSQQYAKRTSFVSSWSARPIDVPVSYLLDIKRIDDDTVRLV